MVYINIYHVDKLLIAIFGKKKAFKMISHSTRQKPCFAAKYAFFCVFYCCFTAFLFSQNTTNSVYIATDTPVFGSQNIYSKKIKKKLATGYIKENTRYYGLNTLKNTRLLFFNRNTKSYIRKSVAKTSQFQTNANASNPLRYFKQADKNPYSNRWRYGKLAVISLVTGEQKNTKREFFLTIFKGKAGASALERAVQNTKKQSYPNQTTIRTSGCWLENTFARHPPQRS
jgi:hypothetical protein